MNIRLFARLGFTAALLVLVVLPLSGCSRKSSGPDVPVSQDKALGKMSASINLLHKELRGQIASEIQRFEKDELQRTNVDVSLRNRTKKNLVIQARTVFKDADGLSLGDETAWRTIYLEPQQAITYSTQSKINTAESATVEVRLPKIAK